MLHLDLPQLRGRALFVVPPQVSGPVRDGVDAYLNGSVRSYPLRDLARRVNLHIRHFRDFLRRSVLVRLALDACCCETQVELFRGHDLRAKGELEHRGLLTDTEYKVNPPLEALVQSAAYSIQHELA